MPARFASIIRCAICFPAARTASVCWRSNSIGRSSPSNATPTTVQPRARRRCKPSQAPGAPQRLNAVPIAFTLRVHDGAIALRAPHALDPQSRSIDIAGVQLDATVNTAARTHYRLRATFAGAPMPSAARPTRQRGYAMNHVRSRALTMRPIAELLHELQSLEGVGRNGAWHRSAYLRAGRQPEAPVDYHLSGHAVIDNASMMLVGLEQPWQHLQGTLQVVDDQLFFNDLTRSGRRHGDDRCREHLRVSCRAAVSHRHLGTRRLGEPAHALHLRARTSRSRVTRASALRSMADSTIRARACKRRSMRRTLVSRHHLR